MRPRRLPPLNLLRGFDAAARHLSFTRAADELHVTQGAISRQVKELELYFRQPLFVRQTRKIELTEAGRHLAQSVASLLDEFEQTCGGLTTRKERKTLTVSALPTVASAWLMPRLHALNEIHPRIELRIIASIEPADLLNDNVDVAIRVGKLPGRRYERDQPRIDLTMLRSWDRVTADELFEDRLIPVCSPELILRKKMAPADFLKFPLIHTSTRSNAWHDWLRAHGVKTRIRSPQNLEFGHFFLSLDAARQCRGIAIVPSIVLACGEGMSRLTIPHFSEVRSAGEYYLLIHESKRSDPHVQLFRNWVLKEASYASGLLNDLKLKAR